MEYEVRPPVPAPEKAVPEFARGYTERRLIILRNPKATNGDARLDEYDELINGFAWHDIGDENVAILDTLPDDAETSLMLAEKIHEADQQSLPGSVIVVMAIGGDKTADVAHNGILAINTVNSKSVLAVASAGRKCDTAVNLGTAGYSLADIIRYGHEDEVYPLDVTVRILGGIVLEQSTLHSVGAATSKNIAEITSDPVWRAKQKIRKEKLQKKLEKLKLGRLVGLADTVHELMAVPESTRKARQEPVQLVYDTAGIGEQSLADFTIPAAGRAGGLARFDTSLHEPQEILIAATNRKRRHIVASAIGRLFVRLSAGRSVGDRWVHGGSVGFVFKGLKDIHMAGDTIQLQKHNDYVSMDVRRGKAATVLSIRPQC